MKNYTTVQWSYWDGKDGSPLQMNEERIYYAQVRDPRYLPDAARCDETIAEWEEWHKAHKTPQYARYLARKMLE